MNDDQLIKSLLLKRINLEKEDQEIVDKWIEQLEKSKFTKELSEHFVVREMIKEMKEEIDTIDNALKTKYDLDTFTRIHLLDKKNLFIRFISIFDLNTLKKEIEKQICQ